MEKPCLFCQIRDGEVSSEVVFRDENTLAFLDHRPLFFGHVLVVPTAHHETLMYAPLEIVNSVFVTVRRLSVAVMNAMEADGIFVANNNIISQSVPHIHVHVIPRNRKDGLRGFMWPRKRYESQKQMYEIAASIVRYIRLGQS